MHKPNAHRADRTPFNFQLTQSGRSLRTQTDLNEYERRFACRKDILHKRIQNKSWDSFLSGDYATSVFAAFKEVEVAVREQGEMSNSDIGRELMKKAFRHGGKLVDASEPTGEQDALSMLFEGRLGDFVTLLLIAMLRLILQKRHTRCSPLRAT